jgi:hypothetical protein
LDDAGVAMCFLFGCISQDVLMSTVLLLIKH